MARLDSAWISMRSGRPDVLESVATTWFELGVGQFSAELGLD